MPLHYLLFDKAVESRPIAFVHLEGGDLLSSGRKLVDIGDIQVAVENESKGTGNGGGGHHQRVELIALTRKDGALIYAEAVLLVGNDKPGACEGGV